MIHSGRFTALLDANVLYPAPLRDFLLHLAALELYKPRWTHSIHDEWIRNLLVNRTDLKKEALEKARNAMNSAFPDANVPGFEDLVNSLHLPDPSDRHILAAAIRGHADVIVTCNLKDFPLAHLGKWDIEAQHPYEFVANLIHLDKAACLRALDNQVRNLKSPPMSKEEVLARLHACGLVNSVAQLKE